MGRGLTICGTARGWGRLILLTAIVFSAWLPAGPAAAETRRALIIANRAYGPEIGALDNPHKDAALIAAALIANGFERPRVLQDAGAVEIRAAVREFAEQLAAAPDEAIGFLYYSGHGVAKPNTGENYLIPIDAESAKSSRIWDESVPLEEVRRRLRDIAPQAQHIVVFDACRNELRLAQRGGKGFAPVASKGGMLTAFSASPGQVAADGAPDAEAGPYAAALAAELFAAKGVLASTLFDQVRFRLLRQGAQRPLYTSELDQAVVFRAGETPKRADGDAPATPKPEPARVPAPLSAEERDGPRFADPARGCVTPPSGAPIQVARGSRLCPPTGAGDVAFLLIDPRGVRYRNGDQGQIFCKNNETCGFFWGLTFRVSTADQPPGRALLSPR